jgi:hypothetical protein
MHLTEKELDFIDEPLLPEQFLTPAYESRRLWTGERRLLLEVQVNLSPELKQQGRQSNWEV